MVKTYSNITHKHKQEEEHVRDVDSIGWQGNVALLDSAQSDRLIGDFKGAENSNRSVTVSHDHRMLLHDHFVDVVARTLKAQEAEDVITNDRTITAITS